MNFTPISSIRQGFAAAAGLSCLLCQGVANPAFAITPVYQTNFTESRQNTPVGSPTKTSFGYFFDTNKDATVLNALGFPIFSGWANSTASPTLFPNADKFEVYVWRVDGIQQPSLLPCDGTTPYCEVAKVTFDQNLAHTYRQKDGYYWQDIAPVNLGPNSIADVDLQYATAAVGNFTIDTGFPTLVGGTGSFDSAFTWSGNGFNSSVPYYTPDFSADFPVPWNFTDDGTTPPDPKTFFAYFSPNLSYTYVPSPLPLLGAGAAFGWARRIRRRVDLARMGTLG